MARTDYSVVIASRALESETEIYKETYDSLLDQTVPPKQIYVNLYYDEKSPYEPREVKFQNLGKEYGTSKTDFVKLIDKWNLAINQIKDQHIVISGDDSYYPKDYFEKLLNSIDENPSIGIIGGKKREKGKDEIERMIVPSGSGRLYTKQFVEKFFPFPRLNCGETLNLYNCETMGLKTSVYTNTYFVHLRKSQRDTLISSGQSAYELNYPFWNTCARVVVWAVTEKEFRPWLVYGHLQAWINQVPKVPLDMQKFVRRSLSEKHQRIAKQLFHHYTRFGRSTVINSTIPNIDKRLKPK